MIVALVSTVAISPAEAGQESSGVVAGRVTDALTRAPLAGATVEAVETAARTVADGKGQFVLSHLPAGPVTLVVSLLGYESERTELIIDPAVSRSIEIGVMPSLDRMAKSRVEPLAEAQRRALDRQRGAPNVTTVVAADQLGRFPDGNAAEALRRVAGVSVLLDRGEAQEVLVRGAPPGLNSVMLNGDRLPSTKGDKRSVDLDVIPADLLQTVEVAKTLLPSTDGDAIGGSVNLIMGEVPPHTAWRMSFAGGGDELTRGFGQASSTVSGGGRLLGGRLGLFAAGSGSTGQRGSDAVTARYAASDLTDVRIRKYLVDRRRAGTNAAADYQLSDTTTVFLHGTFATYTNTEDRQTLRYRISTARLERALQVNKTGETIAMASGGGRHLLQGGAAIDYHLSIGYAQESQPRNLDVDFSSKLRFDPPPVALASTTFAAAEDASAFQLLDVNVDNQFAHDRDVGGVMDFTIPITSGGSSFKAGVKYRTKSKARDLNSYAGALSRPATLADFARRGPAFFGGIGPTIDPTLASALADGLPLVENVGGNAADFSAREDLLAAYAMVELPLTTRLTLIPGVRHEYSTYKYSGSGFDGITTWPLSSKNSNGQWLPGVNVRYAANTDTIVRAAFTRSFARPDFADLVPYEIRQSGAVSSGNPLLKPTVSWNADVAVEHYFRPSGLVSVAVFAKKLDQYIYSFETTTTINGETIAFTQPRNGDAATIMGVELSVQQQLRMLPAPFDSLSVYATYTRTTSDAQYPLRMGFKTPLPGQTPHLGNVTLAYERSGFSGRLATNFHGQYLQRIRRDPANDEHIVGRTQVDLSMAQMVGRRTWLVFDVHNLTDARSQAFAASPSQVTSIERFGRYATFGFRLAF